MAKIVEYILDMLPYMLVVLPVIVVVRYFRIKAMRGKAIHTSVWHESGLMVFFLFIAGLASQTIIPKIEVGNTISSSIGFGLGGINLIPFKVIFETYTEVFVNGHINYFIINFLGNIIMFMPIGFFVPLLWNKISFKKVVLMGFASSLFIEICQLFQARGTDIDDLWINTFGVVLGYTIYLLALKLWPAFTCRFKTKLSNENIIVVADEKEIIR